MPKQITRQTRDTLRSLFLDEGFAKVGFTSADPVEDRISPWISKGAHGSMEYMARATADRSDPATLFDKAASVICVAVAYPRTEGDQAIAGYACAEDYHRTMRSALDRAVKKMEDLLPGITTRICVDSAPLSERAFAARSGLGWIGRNTLLLDEEYGPWTLLGEVLTDAIIEPDAPAIDRCGTCTACIEACPTEALDGQRGLDARRCLSYWTIEHRGPIPDAWAKAMEHRAFGCDDCLTACPFPAQPSAINREGTPAPLELRPDLSDITPEILQEQARTAFKRHFGSTPLERTRKSGLLRNLSIVLDNRSAGDGATVDR
ncbi:MAG: tRNA epoxyqueuosine(34) reductase QueG [Planctomycetota bacterium]|nr:tRNA epoxyqueuosine(34) reductase QueG [Planctomycetota bacterium]